MIATAPPESIHAMRIPPNSALRIRIYNSGVATTVNLTVVTSGGVGGLNYQRQALVTIALAGQTTKDVALTADELHYYSLDLSSLVVDGQVFATVSLVTQVSNVYIEGPVLTWGAVYMSAVHAWAGYPLNKDPLVQSPPFSFTIANPAPGAAINITNNFLAFELISLRYQLITDANVANRVVRIDFPTIAGGVAATSYDTAVIAAGTTTQKSFSQQGSETGPSTSFKSIPIPSIITPTPATIIATAVLIQVGDQFSNIVCSGRQFPPIAVT